jgi:hypothetical protein
LFIDSEAFYFLVAKTKKNQKVAPPTLLTCADTEMIEASFVDPAKIDGYFQVGSTTD